MGLMTRVADAIVKRSSYVPQGYKASPSIALVDPVTRWDMPDMTVVQNQESLIARLSWVQIAVSALARSAAAQAFGVYRRQGEDKKEIGNHPFEELLQRPNPSMSRFEFLEATFSYRALTGNAYWFLNKVGGESAPPDEMFILPPRTMVPVPDGHLGIKGYLYDAGTGRPEVPLEPWEVVHFKSFNPANRHVGLSPIEALAMAVKTDLASSEWNKNYFAENNAKMPGALTFADMLPDAQWEKIQDDFHKKHGGTKRNLLMLRGTGDKAINWVSMGETLKDMEFVAGRTFSKEEIFATFAPGLASVLAVNATEANSLAGKGTFTELAVWPLLVTVAETITNSLLPLYGEGLVSEFEDPRLSDRAMEIREQEVYERTHTIDEIRKTKYEDKPIGDERGELLPAQIGVVLSLASMAADVQAEPDEQAGPEPPPPPQPDEENAAEQKESEAEEPPAAKATQVDLRAEDLGKWRKKALTRFKEGKLDKALQFESEHIGGALKAAIVGALETAVSAFDVEQAFLWRGYP